MKSNTLQYNFNCNKIIPKINIAVMSMVVMVAENVQLFLYNTLKTEGLELLLTAIQLLICSYLKKKRKAILFRQFLHIYLLLKTDQATLCKPSVYHIHKNINLLLAGTECVANN